MNRLGEPVDRPVDGDRSLARRARVDVGEVEASKPHRETDLDRRRLPLAAEGVVEVDVDPRGVERAVLRLDDVRHARSIEGVLDEALGALPQGWVAERLVGLRREREARLEADPAVRLADLAEEGFQLVGQLVRPDVQVGVVLDELADPGQARQPPGTLVAMDPPELAVADRQVRYDATWPGRGAYDRGSSSA
jgi:hypothetical protein